MAASITVTGMGSGSLSSAEIDLSSREAGATIAFFIVAIGNLVSDTARDVPRRSPSVEKPCLHIMAGLVTSSSAALIVHRIVRLRITAAFVEE